MKILFICGSLEPGSDGVGDYTCRMAGELIRQGHQSCVVGLNDKFILTSKREIRKDEETPVNILRIPTRMSWQNKKKIAASFIAEFNPQIASLQFVPYGFHSKGIPIRLPKYLNSLSSRKFKWHIMFHESWIATNKKTIFKNRIVSLLQKFIIKNIIKKLRIKAISTSNVHYQQILGQEGIQAGVLPLPSNIPISTVTLEKMRREFAVLGITIENRSLWTILGIFGTFRSNVDLVNLVCEKYKEVKNRSGRLAFFSMGKSGVHQEQILDQIKRKTDPSIFIHSFGQRDASDISAFFKLIDYGVSTVPSDLAGKSGAFAAMKFHGLDILIPDYSEKTKGSLYEKNESRLQANYTADMFDLKLIASKFINEISKD